MTVNELRKTCDNEEVISLSKTLIKNWKKYLPTSKSGSSQSSSSSSQSSKSSSKSTTSSSSSSSSNHKKSDSHKSDSDRSQSKNSLSNGSNKSTSSASSTTDAVRLKCREMLAQAIRGDGDNQEGSFKTPEQVILAITNTLQLKSKNNLVILSDGRRIGRLHLRRIQEHRQSLQKPCSISYFQFERCQESNIA